VSVRLALGASRGRVVRQLVTEQLLLAGAGGMLGVLLALWATQLVVLRVADQLPRAQEVVLDARVLVAALLVTLAAGVLAGLAPAWRTSSTALRAHMQTRGTVRGGRGLPGAVLVGCEIALAVLLLTGGTLLVRSFSALLARDLGFDAAGVAAGAVALSTSEFRGDTDAQLAFWERLLARMRADPAIGAVAVANWVPTGGGGTSYLVVEGIGEVSEGAGYRAVSEDYFETMRIPLVLGRTFDSSDRAGTQRVAVVNRRLAERHWPGENPIGRRIRLPGMEGAHDVAPWITIVGVVGDVRHYGYEDDVRAEAFVLYRQVPTWAVSLHVVARHVTGDAAQAGGAISAHVRALEPSLAVRVTQIEEQLGRLLATRRITMAVLSGFSIVALVLAALGIYGLLSFAVAQRTPEIGIRAALGASRAGIVRMILRNALTLVALGGAAGLLAAYWLTRLMRALLIDVSSGDARSYMTAAAALGTVATIAALVPAWRAARVDPLTALRRG
jgi:predicted permease